MYLKSILFFCVASFFFQCQGVPPTEEQITMIKEKIASKVGNDGKMDFTQLLNVINEVAHTIVKNYDVNNMDFGFRYTNDQAVIAILSYTAKTNPSLLTLVRGIFEQIMGQDRVVKFDRIKAICAKVAKDADIPEANMDIFESLESQSDRRFHKDDVMTYALAFAATKKPELKKIVKREVRCKTGDLKNYSDIKEICQTVADKAPQVTIGAPKKGQFLAHWKNGTFTAETVENMIYRGFFPS
ncbi:uncharacterized protein LOC126839649 isoform X2 [Adelges cooleyi]|uniref:uncharacterized protein LOC126839649 isoform X2 n=1 Tax=Adelges cooleyi TaxID=133065 RepID=UPI002180025F|nr:uncharacterized protein LOC126839649 isoform X2 [Adelges cooleyi]